MPTLDFLQINWLAVIVAGFATFMLGGAWYTALFGKAWQAAHGFTADDVRKAQAQMSPPKFFGGMLVCYLVLALGMAIVQQWAGVGSLPAGATLGFTIGLVIVTPIVFTNHLPSMVKMPGFVIDASYSLIYCTMIGAILGAWR